MKRFLRSKKGIAVMMALLLALTAGSIYAYSYTKTLACQFNQHVYFEVKVPRGDHKWRANYTLKPYYTKLSTDWTNRTCDENYCLYPGYYAKSLVKRYDSLKMEGTGVVETFWKKCY